MDSFLRNNDASIIATIIQGRTFPSGTELYLPSNIAFNKMLTTIGLTLKELQTRPTFQEILANHINPRGFPKSEGKIGPVPIYKQAEISINGGTIDVYVIDGVLVTPAQSASLKAIQTEFPEGVPTEKVITNPKTGRDITVDGPTYKKLLKAKIITGNEPKRNRKAPQPKVSKAEAAADPAHIARIKALVRSTGPQTIQAKGWGDIGPKRGKEREALKKKCGDGCFLRPQDNAFPICPKDTCAVDCRGLAAAKNRARFLPNEFRDQIIPDLQKHFDCK